MIHGSILNFLLQNGLEMNNIAELECFDIFFSAIKPRVLKIVPQLIIFSSFEACFIWWYNNHFVLDEYIIEIPIH